MSQEQADYITEAMEMIGQGYEQPAAIIDLPRTVKALQEGGLVDYKVWGWVKMSAKFLAHLKYLKGAKLAIWQCIALSIDETGKCKRTIKEIVELTDYSHTEVVESIKELEDAGYLSVSRLQKNNIYSPVFVARGEEKPKETLVKKLESTPPYQYESSPSKENSVPSYKELKELIQKEINMNTDLSVWEIANGAYKHLSEKGLKISGKQKQELREYLSSLDVLGNEPKPAKTQPKKKEDKVNTDIKTIARSRGVSEDMIKFIDRACKAFGFSIMQIDEVALSVYEWVIQQESKGRTIEAFADWARTDEMGKFIGKYRNSAGNIKNDWARAFGLVSDDERTSLIRRMT